MWIVEPFKICRCNGFIAYFVHGMHFRYDSTICAAREKREHNRVGRNRFEVGIIAISLFLVSAAKLNLFNPFGNVSMGTKCAMHAQLVAVTPHGPRRDERKIIEKSFRSQCGVP